MVYVCVTGDWKVEGLFNSNLGEFIPILRIALMKLLLITIPTPIKGILNYLFKNPNLALGFHIKKAFGMIS